MRLVADIRRQPTIIAVSPGKYGHAIQLSTSDLDTGVFVPLNGEHPNGKLLQAAPELLAACRLAKIALLNACPTNRASVRRTSMGGCGARSTPRSAQLANFKRVP